MTAAVLRPVVRRRRILPRRRCPGSMTGVASLPMSTPGRRRASTVAQPGRPAAGSNSPARTGRRAQLTRRPVAPEIATPGPLRFPGDRHGVRGAAGHRLGELRPALAAGLSGERRRRAVISLAGSLRNLGQAEESVALLRAELDRGSDHLDDAVRAF